MSFRLAVAVAFQYTELHVQEQISVMGSLVVLRGHKYCVAFRFRKIKKLKSIIEDEPDLCGISDRNISITNTFSRVYSRAYHRLFLRQVTENLCVNQHYGEHLYLFYIAEKAYYFDDFKENYEKLKYSCLEAAHVLENMFDFEKYSRAHFLGNRYDVITTNIAELLNSVLMDKREYPMSYVFNSLAKKIGEKFTERYAYVDGKKNIFVPYAEKILRDSKSSSDSLYMTNPNGVLDQYTVFGNGATAKVNLLKRSCSCQKFNLVRISYEQAMATLRAKHGDGIVYGNSIYEYSSLIYKAASYLLVYS
ncbi:hypothetical protein CQW23_28073 [Capsicum baccatum]|uniref:Uncharacterized protein n=1 Tax=Capsicum baccatum TaxID=33114 RepID=A0A2G2VFI7_CAPBA|nr:hypothetical protein CQW23_28073 [Capsicum baccatum]